MWPPNVERNIQTYNLNTVNVHTYNTNPDHLRQSQATNMISHLPEVQDRMTNTLHRVQQ